jgi:membrane protein implicated in regulation of membrane protease activity
MNKRVSTRGASASIIIIAILFLALMASLGVVFYQNFVQKKPETKQTQTTSDTSEKMATRTQRITFDNAIYDVDYPGTGWTADAKSSDKGSIVELTNTAGTVKALLEVGPTQPKNACDTQDGLQISDYTVSETPVVTKLTSQPLFLVEAIFDAAGGGYRYVSGLIPEGGETHASVGASRCEVVGVGMASQLVMSGKTIQQPAITARITFPKLPIAPKAAAPDRQTLKDFMSSDDYKAAVKILESARKE